jgi:hypothetical protein
MGPRLGRSVSGTVRPSETSRPPATSGPDPMRLFVMIFVVATVVTVIIIWLGINGQLGWGIPGTSHRGSGGIIQLISLRTGAR